MIELKVSEKFQNKFMFKLHGKELASAIDKIMGVSAFGNATAIMRRHMFVSYKSKLYLVGYNSNCCIAVDLKTKTDKNGSFNIEPERLKGLVKSRAELAFKYTGSELKIKKGNFESSIKTSPVTVDQFGHINEYFGIHADSSDALGSELLNKLRVGVKKTLLVDYTDNGQISPVVVIFKDKLLSIFTQNDYSGALYETNIVESHEAFSMSVSNEVFNLVSKTIDNDSEEEKADFFFLNDHFLVSTSDIYICLPPLQESEKDTLPVFRRQIESLDDEKGVHTRNILSSRNVLDTLSGVTVISQNIGHMTLAVDKKGNHTFKSSSDEGSIKDTVPSVEPKAKSKVKVKSKDLDVTTSAKTIYDLVSACGEQEVQVSIHQVNGISKPNIIQLQTPSNFVPAAPEKKSSKKKKKGESVSYERLRQFTTLQSAYD